MLLVRINRVLKTATFSGSGTFAAKDAIKELGQARWLQDQKSWEIRQFSLSTEELARKFADLRVEEEVFSESVEEQVADTALLPTELPNPSAANARPTLSVAELTTAVRNLLRERFSSTVLVYGVLSSVKELRDGKIFIDLADPERPDDIVRCVIWRDAEKICKPLIAAGFKLEADLQVLFEVTVDLSRKWAGLSLSIVGIVAEYTIAKLAARREQTNERLKKEGLFERNKETKLPFLPKRLGLLTSAGGTVLHDFRAALDQSKFGFELLRYNVNVQGPEAKGQLIRGLQTLASIPGLDAILIFRGGGSPADLAVFNEYEIAQAVCMCPIPVISAIGHQEDQSSVQDVSFLALGVPKDIGHYFAQRVIERRRETEDMVRTIRDRVGAVVASVQERLAFFSGHLYSMGSHVARHRGEVLNRAMQQFPVLTSSCCTQALLRIERMTGPAAAFSERTRAMHQERFLVLGTRVSQQMLTLVERMEQMVHAHQGLVTGASPEVQLKRGFSLIRRAGTEEIVTTGAALRTEDVVEIQFHDQVRGAKIVG